MLQQRGGKGKRQDRPIGSNGKARAPDVTAPPTPQMQDNDPRLSEDAAPSVFPFENRTPAGAMLRWVAQAAQALDAVKELLECTDTGDGVIEPKATRAIVAVQGELWQLAEHYARAEAFQGGEALICADEAGPPWRNKPSATNASATEPANAPIERTLRNGFADLAEAAPADEAYRAVKRAMRATAEAIATLHAADVDTADCLKVQADIDSALGSALLTAMNRIEQCA